MKRIREICRRIPWRLAGAAALLGWGIYIKTCWMGYTVSAFVLWTLAAVLIAAHLLRRHRVPLWILRGVTALAILMVILGEIPPIRTAHRAESGEAPYLVVLGALVNGEEPSASLVERLAAAQKYLAAHPDTVAILSGGQGRGEAISEAEAMRRWLTARGIEEDRLIKEDLSTSTRENLDFSFSIIRSRGDDPANGVAILSSEYHLYRACRMAEEVGAVPLGVPARTGFWGLRWNYYLRESLAVWYMWVFG